MKENPWQKLWRTPFTASLLAILLSSVAVSSKAAAAQSNSSAPAASSSTPAPQPSQSPSGNAPSSNNQSGNGQTIDLQSAARNEEDPYAGSVIEGQATSNVLQLTLDDAIARGIRNNLALTEARARQRAADAQILESLNHLLPVVKLDATTGENEFNLVSEGFNPSILPLISTLIPGLNPSSINLIVRVDVTQAQATYDETLFSLEDWTRYRASKVQAKAAYFNTQSSRGLVVLNVGDAYLQSLAYSSNVDNQAALLRADEVLLNQVVAEHQAGTVARIDELRARVQYQQQQQQLLAAQNQFEKSLIALKRRIGIPIEQQIQLSDAAPFSDLEAITPDQARLEAYQNRQDYQGLQQQIDAAVLNRKAARYERLPTIIFNGNYGVTGVSGGTFHDTFSAVGTLSIPVFKEAAFRGDEQVAATNLRELNLRFNNLKEQIDQQLRDSLLDVQTATELVHVARSNVELAQNELEQSNDQFQAGTSDNLPVVQAQATLASAQTQLVQSTLQFNEAKLGLARNLGIVDTQYKTYLRGK